MLVCFNLSCGSECTLLIIVYNNYDLLLGATRATHGAIFGTLAHASFMVRSITHHTKDTMLPPQMTPHIDLSGVLMTNELRCHLPNRKRTLWSPHLSERHCNYEDSEVSQKCGKLRQIKAKTENPTYCLPPTCTPIPQCLFNKNQASPHLNHPKRRRHHPTTAYFVSGRSPFTPQSKRGLSLVLPHFDAR